MDTRLFLMLYLASFRELRLGLRAEGSLEEARPVETQLHRVRDGLALLQLTHACERAGSRHDEVRPILNLPRALQNLLEEDDRLGENAKSHPHPRKTDLLVQATRPPLDDHGRFEDDGQPERDDLRDERRWIPRS